MGQVFGTVGRLQHIETITLTAAGTTFDFTGLSGQKRYILLFEGDNNTASNALCSLYINNDTTPTNYYSQYVYASHTTIAGARVNTAQIVSILSSAPSVAQILIQKTIDNFVICTVQNPRGTAAAIQFYSLTMQKTAAVAEITQLTFVSQQNMKIGSKLSLYEVKE